MLPNQKNAFLLSLVVISAVSVASHTASVHTISKRAQIPVAITCGEQGWAAEEILDAIRTARTTNNFKYFVNKGVPKKPGCPPCTLFPNQHNDLLECDLVKPGAPNRGRVRVIFKTTEPNNKRAYVGMVEHVHQNCFQKCEPLSGQPKNGPTPPGSPGAARPVPGTDEQNLRDQVGQPEAGSLFRGDAPSAHGSQDGHLIRRQVEGCECPLEREEEETSSYETSSEQTAPGEEGKLPENAGMLPEIETGLASPDDAQLVEVAESISDKEFAEAAAKRGLTGLAEKRWSLSLKDVRTKLKYQRLTPKSPKLRGGSFKAPGVGPGPAAVIGGAVWVSGVVNAFVHDASALDRAVAMTAIIPFVGCSLQMASDVEQGKANAIDTTMCFLGDGLLLSPIWPIGIVVQVFRTVIKFFHPPDIPTNDEMRKARDKNWNRYLDDNVYTYIYSHPFLYPNEGFRDKLESSLAIEALAVLSEGAQSIGVMQAGGQAAMNGSSAGDKKIQIEKGSQEATEKLRAAISKEIVRRQRQLLVGLPKALHDDTKLSVKPTADQYNKNFADYLLSQKMIDKYKVPIVPVPGSPLAYPLTNEADVRAKLRAVARHLLQTPPTLPGYFDLAYIIGQSRGLVSLDPQTLSLTDYVREKLPGQPDHYVNLLAVHHTLNVGRLLGGKIQEDKLSKMFPTEDAQTIRDLQTLAALKFGRVYDEWKFKRAHEEFATEVTGYFLEAQRPGFVRYLSHPDVPPVKADTEAVPFVALVVGLSEATVKSLIQEITLTSIYKDSVGILSQEK